jgi:quinol monooxygenase YgiN
VVFSLRVKAPEGKRDDILLSVRSLVGPATADKACLACRVFQEADDPNAITFIEAWDTRSDLERHVRSHQYRHLLSVLDLSKTVPEIRIDEVSAVDTGIGALAAMAADNHQKNQRG